MDKKINWLNVLLKTILFCGLSILLLIINQFIVFFSWGSGEGASRKMELPHINFLLNYSPLILLGGYLSILILKYLKSNFLKSKTNLIVLVLLILFYLFKDNFLYIFI